MGRLVTAKAKSKEQALSVVICTFDRYESLKKVIASLNQERLCGLSFEILIIDNSPDQNKARAAAKKFENLSNFKYLLESSPGLSNARNVGWKAAHGKIVAYLDDDALVHPGWAKSLLKGFELAGTQAGLAGGKVEIGWPHERPSWMHDRILPYLGYCNFGDETKVLSNRENIVGCNMAFRKETLVATGGFDLNLGRKGDGQNLLSNEETQLSKLLQKAGIARIYLPGMLVTHLVAPERLEKDWFRQRFAWQAVSDVAARNGDLRVRVLRAKFRRITLPPLREVFRFARMAIGVRSDQWDFYLELETLYDKTLLSIHRKK